MTPLRHWLKPRCWRAPSWSPPWMRRAFPGCWTQKEIDRIWKDAGEMSERITRLMSRSEQVCPECIQGKHTNCDGTTWDVDADAPTDCLCAVHDHDAAKVPAS